MTETLTVPNDPMLPETLRDQQGIRELAEQHNSYFVHAVVPDEWLEDSSPIMSSAADFDTKLDISIGYRPHLAGSALSPDYPGKNIFYEMGLLVADGAVDEVHSQDVRSSAGSLQVRSRSSVAGASEATIGDVINDEDPRHNEVTIQNPRFAGLYWRPDGGTSDQKALPEELAKARERLGLPVFVIGEDAVARPIIELRQDNSFLLGEAVLPSAVEAHDGEIDTAAIQEDLLERGVFKMAGQERELVSASEKGRLAYFTEYGDPRNISSAGEDIEFKTTDKAGYSWIANIAMQGVVGRVTISEKNDAASGKSAEVREYAKASDIERNRYAISLPWMGHDITERYGLDENTVRSDKSTDFIDYTEQCVSCARAVIANLDEDPGLIDIQRRTNPNIGTELNSYLEEVGFSLFGLAAEANNHGDIEIAERAKKLAESLVAIEKYQEIIDKRLSPRTGDFRLMPEDVT